MSLTGLGRLDLFQRFKSDFSANLDTERLVSDSIRLTVEMSSQARENPSVATLARHASGRLPIAVVTNSEASIAHAVLSKTALHTLFDCILTVEDAPRPKPAPDLYLAAAARLGVEATRCLVLEDSDQGISAARTAGMKWADVRLPDWPAKCAGLIASLKPSPANSMTRCH